MNSEKIVQYIQKHCIADDWTLNITKDDSHETRFAQMLSLNILPVQ